MSDLEAFLAHTVDKYIFGDFERMRGVGVGYPMIMTAFAGIELLGALLSADPFNPNRGGEYFTHYWSEHLYPIRPRSREEGARIYKLVRHGIAHAYVLKGAIRVVSGHPYAHLVISHGYLLIDRIQLADDLMASYNRDVRPFLAATAGAVNGAAMAERLGEMRNVYQDQADLQAIAEVFPTISSSMAVLGDDLDPDDIAQMSGGYPGASGPL